MLFAVQMLTGSEVSVSNSVSKTLMPDCDTYSTRFVTLIRQGKFKGGVSIVLTEVKRSQCASLIFSR